MAIARIFPGGQITIPAEVRRRLSLKDGDKVMFVESDEGVMMVNSSIAALKAFQKAMEGEAEKAGLYTEEDVIALCREVRHDLAKKRNADHS